MQQIGMYIIAHFGAKCTFFRKNARRAGGKTFVFARWPGNFRPHFVHRERAVDSPVPVAKLEQKSFKKEKPFSFLAAGIFEHFLNNPKTRRYVFKKMQFPAQEISR